MTRNRVNPRGGDVEHVYPLSPLQEGILFHSLASPGSGVYVSQAILHLERADLRALEAAWQALAKRHGVLRTAFAWQGTERAMQVVARELRVPLAREDWRGVAESEQGKRLEALLAEDRRRGFALSKAPLVRLTLVRQDEVRSVLVWTYHHILLDGWSVALVLKELVELYQAFAEERALELPRLQPYRDYVDWLAGRDLAPAERFWREHLRGYSGSATLDLGAPCEAPPGDDPFARCTTRLSAPLSGALRGRARSGGLTLNTLVQGAWAIALARYMGVGDVVYGTTVAGRPPEIPGVEGMVGLFINTVPTRVRVAWQAPLPEWLRSLQSDYAEVRRYEETPLVAVQGWSELPRGRALFEALYAFESYPVPTPRVTVDAGTFWIRRAEFRDNSHYPLALAVRPDRELQLHLLFDRRRFDAATAERVLAHLTTLLGGIAAGAACRVGELPMLPESEERRLLVGLNATAVEVAGECSVVDLFREQARRAPRALAVAAGGEELDYATLDRRSERLARVLRSRGQGPGTVVGLYAERSAELVIGALATLKTGAAYLPLDPGHPPERLAFMLEDSGVALVLTQARLQARLPAGAARIVAVDGEPWPEPSSEPPAARPPAPRDLAYVIYTSGSTGRPKGVQVEHEGLVNLVQWHRRAHAVDGASRATLVASPAFDASVWEMWPYLASGASLHVPSEETRSSAAALIAWLSAERISHCFLPTPLAEAVLEEPGVAELGLRRLLTGGDKLHRRPLPRLPFRLFNHYGPTEGTVVATWAEVVAGEPHDPPIGRPIDNARLYVLDEQLRPAPEGVAGELFVGGIGVARGYLGQAGLSAERFLPDPFSGAVGARLYRTGDRVRYRPDGNLEFLGRLDGQVKVRGFRVEPGEIESALVQAAGVREAVVVLREDEPGRPCLVAYVTPRGGAALAGESLVAHLRGLLPEPMVPAAIVVLERLPVGPNGKLDRNALPEPSGARRLPGAGAPRTPIEEGVAEIWSRVLGVERPGVDDDFFAAGGHSLIATRLVSQLRRTFGVELPLRALFEAPTVAGLARLVEAGRGRPHAGGPSLVPRELAGEAPLSFAQQRLWFLDQLGAGAAYNIPFALRASGSLDVPALCASLAAMARRHETLRTEFPAPDGRPRQRIRPELELTVAEVDLSRLPAHEREAEARRLGDEDAQRPFDLARGPLVRARLLRLAEHEHVLLLTIHHILADGWSMGVVARELGAHYRGCLSGAPPQLPELAVQYADFAVWQREWLSGERLEALLAYWRERLGGELSPLELPTDRRRPAVQTFRGARALVELPGELSAGLAALARRAGATLFMVLLAGFKALLSRYSGQRDIVVGSPIANRNRAEIEPLIGFFVNSLVLRTNLGGDPSFRDLVERVKETALGAYDHQDLPFEKLVEELEPGRDLAQNPLFQTVFAVQNAPWETLELPGLQLAPFARESRSTRFDLEVHVLERRGALLAALVYNTDLFDAGTVERLGRHWLNLLAAAVEDPGRRLSALPLAEPGEERTVLALGRGATREASPRAVDELFAEQVRRAPDAPAVVHEGGSLSYAELEGRANRLARHLKRLGVGREARVGVCLERSPELVLAVLGIMKAGGAYVALDPDHPPERLGFMLRDSGAVAVVTLAAQAGRLAGSGVATVCLDRDAAAIEREAAAAVASGAAPGDLAYVIYTSGSTGRPKGVELEHRGLSNLVAWHCREYALAPGDRTTLVASPGFDASVWELWPALVAGASLHVPDESTRLQPERLLPWLTRRGITLSFLPTPLAEVVLREPTAGDLPLRALLTGGDRLHRVEREGLPFRLVNHYGPTECSVVATGGEVEPGEPGEPTIGRPIDNTRAHVLDERLRPAPLGVAGELYLGGPGVARGYCGRPDLTAERFLPDPLSGEPGARLYRTGDRARCRPDGSLEFLGRADQQVKVRGFRIELTEIESVLAEHPAVGEAAVVAHEDAAGPGTRLAAFVVARPAGPAAGSGAPGPGERVAQWHDVYESVVYDQLAVSEPAQATFNLAGWNSTYTGLPIPAEEMREQVEQTVARILAGRPRRVLEIGCGTGLLLFRLAPHCERYVGTDFSGKALEYVRRQLDSLPVPLPHVELRQGGAEDLGGLAVGGFDAVLLNSVIQYFPDVDYLRTVLEGALLRLAPGGRLIVGDVRHLPLLETFAASVVLHQSRPGLPKSELRERVKERLAQEQELVVAPEFFAALVGQLGVEGRLHVSPKRGRGENELVRYRYDVIFEKGLGSAAPAAPWLDWEEDGLSLASLRQRLADQGPETLAVRRVPNERVRVDALTLAWLSREDDEPRPQDDGQGVDPEAIWALGELGYEVDLSWGASHPEGRYDLLLRRRSDGAPGLPCFPVPEAAARSWREYTTDPLAATRLRGLVPELRRHLQQRLPDYMVPASFVLLEALPLTPSGKVDQRALVERELARPGLGGAFEGPRTAVEEELARIWAKVLGVARVGVQDNFFELGGDSILSIQIVARAAQAGLQITPKQIFQHQTIGELAPAVGSAPGAEAEQGLLLGPVPLTPIQHWFFEQEPQQPHHFNQALLLQPRRALAPGVLEQAVRALEEHHDALRLRFERGALGWRARFAPPGADAFVRVDLSGAKPGEEAGALLAAAGEIQSGLDIGRGPLWRVALLDPGGGRPDRVLVVIHHLAVDGMSWRVLVEDLETACSQLLRGERVRLPRKTSSFRQWAERLRDFAESPELREELRYWRAVVAGDPEPLPVDSRGQGSRASEAATVTVALEPEETRALLQDVPAAYHTQIGDALATALVRAFRGWTGRGRLRLDMEGHGREELFADIDLSRTVGWFTTLFPVQLELPEGAGLGGELKAIKEQLRAIPRRGLGWGVLRYLGGESGRELAASAASEVSFNYLGQLDQTLAGEGLFTRAPESAGATRGGDVQRRHRLELNSAVAGGRLSISCTYDTRAHRPATVEALCCGVVDELRALIAHCRSAEAGGHTPSDFPLARLDQAQLDAVLAGDRQVEDVYPLSPLQHGLLFHSLLAPASGVYVEQLLLELRGSLDPGALARAFQSVVDRQPVLRSRFAWQGLPRPVQVVLRRVPLPWREHDWRSLPVEQQDLRLAALVDAERTRGFEFTQAPLTRVDSVRRGDERWDLVWSFHHAVLDGWSIALLLKAVSAAYQSLRAGGEPGTAPGRPFRDYIGWLAAQDPSRAEAFWRQTLGGVSQPTPLPLDRRPGSGRHDGGERGVQSLRLSPLATATLKALGREHQITLGTFVQAAWALLLGRSGGGDDVVFGVNGSGRPPALPGVESMVGLFVSTLPMRARIDERAPLAKWLGRLQAEQLEQRQFEYSALSDVQAWSELPPGCPLFESILAFENYPVDPAVRELGAGVGFRYVGSTSYPLNITASAPGAELGLRVGHDRDRFSDEAARRLLEWMRRLLEGMAAGLERPVGTLSLLDDRERRQVVVEWNETRTQTRAPTLLHRAFEAQAELTPDAVAVQLEDSRLSYRQLNARANQLAHNLRRRGVGPEAIVGICLERSLELVIALLGTLKAGAAYAPLDPGYPPARLGGMLEDAGIQHLVTTSEIEPRLPPARRVLCLDVERPNLAVEPQGDLETRVEADNLAYVIYTSGSTGRPKGVMIPHRAIANHMAWMQSAFPLSADDRVLQKTPLSFDASVWEFYAPLLAGARLVLARPDGHRDSRYLVEAIRRHRITVLQVVPTLLRLLIGEPGFAECRSLERVFCGGEALDQDLVRRFGAVLDAELHNLYGPTEATIDATIWSHRPGHEPDGVPIGRPIHNVTCYVLDRQLRPVPPGVGGELHIGGLGLARGYRGQPDLTAASFVPDPFAPEPGARLYRTGDRARYRTDGEIEFLGRGDAQVKLRGYRIEPGEIETQLERHPAVRQAAVVVRAEAPEPEQLVAYWTAAGPPPTLADLRRHLQDTLPAQMIPSAFVCLDSLPLTPSGKLDRRALPAPGAAADVEGFEAPRNDAEATLARIWKEVLRVEAVGIRDDFFALGGDSILSLQAIARANEAGLRLSLKQLFARPTVAELAAEAALATPEAADAGPVTGPVPLTPIQRWFFEQPVERFEHYNQAVILEVRQVSAEVVEQGLAVLERHHDALRLRFVDTGSGWEQRCVEPRDAVPLERLDLSELAEPEAGRALDQATRRAHSSLNLGRGPVWRAVFLERGGGRRQLLLVIHHLVVDAVSWRVLLADLERACAQLAAGEVVKLPARTTPFPRWAELLLERAASGAFDAELPYWRAVVASATPLPVDHADADALDTVASERSVTVRLAADETRALLQEVPGAYRTQVGDVLLAALLEALGAWTSCRSLLVDLEGHGREEIVDGVDLTRTVGWFTSLYPVRLERPPGGPGELLMGVKEQLRAVPGHGIGFGVLRYLRSAGLRSPAEVSFNYLGQFDPLSDEGAVLALAAERTGPGQGERGRRGHRLEVSGAVIGGSLRLDLAYSEAVHDRATVERLARGFADALRQLIAHCRSGVRGCTPSDFPLARLDAPALERVLAGGSEAEDIYPLAPMQEGMLFHSLASRDGSAYCEQVRFEIEGELDSAALARAWRRAVARHAVLRSRFCWRGLPRPLQVVQRGVELPWSELDWRGLAEEEQRRRFEELLEADERQGFDLERAPLLRLALVRLGPTRHRLVWSFHHALLDGWSSGLLLRDVLALYRAERGGGAAGLSQARRYREFVAWLERQDRAAAERYWRQELAGITAPTRLPGLGPAGDAAASGTIEQRVFTLREDVSRALVRLGRRHGLTLATLVQGAWAIVLGRTSGEGEVVFGVTVSGRPAELPGVEGMVGLFINTLPLRVPVAGRPPVLAWLQDLQARQLEQRRYEYSPLALVQRWSGVAAGHPLFDSLLVFENYPIDSLAHELGAQPRLRVLGASARTNYPLTLVATPGPTLKLRLLYASGRCGADAVERLQAHLERVLECLGGVGPERLSDLSLLGERDERRILQDWNATATPAPRQSVLELFQEQVRLAPDAPAVESDTGRLSYGELDARANRLARRLRRLGAGRERCVAVCVERSMDLVVAVLGVVKTGAAYLALDPGHPPERLAFMLSDSGAVAVVAHATKAEALAGGGAAVVCLDRDEEPPAPEPAGPAAGAVSGAQLAYAIYTSGSTGRPKGVELHHEGLSNLVAWHRRAYALGPADRTTLLASPGFDASVWELWPAVTSGASLHVPSESTRLQPRELVAWLARQRVTVAFLPTPLAEAVLREPGLERLSLRLLLTGGDRLHRVTRDRLPFRLVNHYGPTECTVVATSGAVEPGERGEPSIGRPIDNTRAYVLDEQRRLVPPGVVGELFLAGAGVARGYRARPDLTAESFVPDPFAPTAGSRLYRTGDRVRYREDGSLEFLGRGDGQVKVRGVRIELAEIEAVLAQHPAVAEAAVVARPTPAGETRLSAYVTRLDGEPAEADEIRRWLRERLPEAMVPLSVATLPEMPRTRSGKLDRGALPPGEGDGGGGRALAPARDALEEAISAAWREVLELERVGIHENFFDLGGHSLSLVRLHGRLREQVAESLTVVELFEHPTVASLAEHLRRPAAAVVASDTPELARRLQEGRARLEHRRGRRDPRPEPPVEPPAVGAAADRIEEPEG